MMTPPNVRKNVLPLASSTPGVNLSRSFASRFIVEGVVYQRIVFDGIILDRQIGSSEPLYMEVEA